MSEVWVVYRTSGGMDDWSIPKEIIVSEHHSEAAAREAARNLDWGKDMGATNWHHYKKVQKNFYYT